MVEKSIVVTSSIGLQGRGSARLAHAANQFESDLLLVNDVCIVNAKDVMQVLRFSARAGSRVRVQASGSDEAAAVKRLVALLTA
ncbi:phosphocarrier protein HPr [Cupriavidus metallidurans]|uniref:Phosphocarrier protein HPr n=1 Tax=Cupriavidus metallidurans (strain ATCC 43123 / DSM 2839 / NBRC 102507 / CH34) TaxID=266264 RepID=Q1LEA0_CUPMC|nr:HPr family phosphocarrier protein [Cupriavidus metallidurans]ABF11526.1 Phosphoryl transfer system, HPr [Cupriavidus metallidurans CH34]KWW32726.1 HPr-like protein Crh [Cupriavidus metallidurans]MDE4920096.1 HPr family phosphocarrier protein [Cupriavidus metallidurans]UBM08002.1 HPr family phosphocarrier protein [Cupriavidus metallidurans]